MKLSQIEIDIPKCKTCPELRDYCAEVARTRRRAYADQKYWGRPVSGFGDPRARLWIIGLAPGAHGANRTGRVFTGDRSGDFLYAALHRAGYASQAESTRRDDGLTLRDAYISAAGRCAPPANKLTPLQLANCSRWLDLELGALTRARVIICLGQVAWNAALGMLVRHGATMPRPKPKFGHAAEVTLADHHLIGCYHVSQQNTFTGRLTEPMLDAVLNRARELSRG